jgi:phage gp45-like
MLANLIRWVRVRSLREGFMQSARVEGLPNDARDGTPRPQDYGFSGNPGQGEGLRLEIDGNTVIIRLDRSAERPELALYEVAMWHKEGHSVTLKAGRVVQVDCDVYRVNASTKVEFNTPDATFSGTVHATGDIVGAGKSVSTHVHGSSGPPS